MFRYILIEDGTFAVKVQDHPLTLVQMQEAVGGFIELFQTAGSIDFFCNEEGRIKAPLAPPSVLWGDFLVFGPVLVTGNNAQGELRSLTDRDITTVLGMLDYSEWTDHRSLRHLPRLAH